ncbi:dephospho-CoA kinase [Methylosinus sp. sav-2]|jgi:dephospho-CoA kinase|uniref:dephospho-CoA kinase n=1 Tax=Methylosinus sp. sav-2 TaxID=2485168 RepID=UPI000479A8AF|nr:dephospho-CoA kinase [Methylosinus sp. sav-2]TDX67008.1 dephospho-CoA kinase [Methylosinus sp. sav-2]
MSGDAAPRPLVIGLTGSIGMGKSTTADLFRAEGVPVYDSDRAVHELYRGPAAAQIEEMFPGATVDGVVDRARLAAHVLGDGEALRRLEALVHPLVAIGRDEFLENCRRAGERFVVFDIPLLFEIGAQKDVDAVVVVSAPPEIQRARVLARPGMTEEKFAAILAKQVPDAQKRAGADFVVHSERGLDSARQEVRLILEELARRKPSR